MPLYSMIAQVFPGVDVVKVEIDQTEGGASNLIPL